MVFLQCCLIVILGAGTPSAAAPDSVSITLNEALVLARQHAPEPRRILAARRAAQTAQFRTLAPSPLVASVEYGFIPRGAAISGFGERTFALDQTLPNPVSMYHRIKEGKALRGQMGDEAREALRAYSATVTGAYYRSIVQRERLAFARQQRDGAATIMHMAEVRHKAGDAARIEMQTAKTVFAESDIFFEREEIRVQQALMELSALLGAGENGTTVYVPTDSLPHPVLRLSDEELLSAVLQRSPGIQAARRGVEAARASASLAVSDIFPSFSVGVMQQRQAGSSAMYGFRVGLAVPLWFAFDQHRAIESTDARVTEAEERLRALEITTRSWVLSSIAALRARERELLRYEQEIVPQAGDLVRMSERAWSAGESAFLDVVQARRRYSDIAIDALDTHAAYLEIWTELQSMLDEEEL